MYRYKLTRNDETIDATRLEAEKILGKCPNKLLNTNRNNHHGYVIERYGQKRKYNNPIYVYDSAHKFYCKYGRISGLKLLLNIKGDTNIRNHIDSDKPIKGYYLYSELK